MFHVTSSLLGGLAAVTAWALVAPSSDPAVNAPGDTGTQVNRADKADRLIPPRLHRDTPAAVATVEVIGVRDAAIVYRDRSGRILFQTDPVSNVTVVSKGFALPQLTVRDTSHSTPVPIEAPRELPAAPTTPPAIPIGCEPLASPIVQPHLARLAGRCLSQAEDAGAHAG
jgi:hypothetical protein